MQLPDSGPQRFDVQLITRDGRQLPLGSTMLSGTNPTWGARIPMSLTSLAQLRFVSANGQTTIVADLNAHGPWGSG